MPYTRWTRRAGARSFDTRHPRAVRQHAGGQKIPGAGSWIRAIKVVGRRARRRAQLDDRQPERKAKAPAAQAIYRCRGGGLSWYAAGIGGHGASAAGGRPTNTSGSVIVDGRGLVSDI